MEQLKSGAFGGYKKAEVHQKIAELEQQIAAVNQRLQEVTAERDETVRRLENELQARNRSIKELADQLEQNQIQITDLQNRLEAGKTAAVSYEDGMKQIGQIYSSACETARMMLQTAQKRVGEMVESAGAQILRRQQELLPVIQNLRSAESEFLVLTARARSQLATLEKTGGGFRESADMMEADLNALNEKKQDILKEIRSYTLAFAERDRAMSPVSDCAPPAAEVPPPVKPAKEPERSVVSLREFLRSFPSFTTKPAVRPETSADIFSPAAPVSSAALAAGRSDQPLENGDVTSPTPSSAVHTVRAAEEIPFNTAGASSVAVAPAVLPNDSGQREQSASPGHADTKTELSGEAETASSGPAGLDEPFDYRVASVQELLKKYSKSI